MLIDVGGPTVDDAIPRQMGLGCLRKVAEQVSKQSPPPMVFVSAPASRLPP